MNQRFEFPADLRGVAAQALLLLKSDQQITAALLKNSEAGTSSAVQQLSLLGWPIQQVPGVQPCQYKVRKQADAVAAVEQRFRSRAYAEWESDVAAAIAGRPLAEKPKPKASVWSAEAYTGRAGARLSHPASNRIAIRLFYLLMHVREATPETASISTLQFIAAYRDLASLGWPVTLLLDPVKVVFDDDVTEATADAWCATFGARNQDEALAGTLGMPPAPGPGGYR